MIPLEAIVRLFLTGPSSVMGWAAAAVFKQCLRDHQEMAEIQFVEQAGIGRLFGLLNSNIEEDRLSAARALSGCATKVELCEPIVENGGFDAIFMALRDMMAWGISSAIWLASAVREVACLCPSRLDPTTVSAVMTPLMEMLVVGDYGSKQVALNAITHLAVCAIHPFDNTADEDWEVSPGQAIKWKGLNERVVPQLAELLETGDTESKALALELLRKLAPMARTHAAIVDSALIPVLVRLMRVQDETATAKYATSVLWSLLSSHRTQLSLREVDFPMLEVMVRILDVGTYFEMIQCARNFARFAGFNSAVRQMVDLGAIPALVKLLRSRGVKSNKVDGVETALDMELEGQAKAEGAVALDALVSADATAQSIAFHAGAVDALIELLLHGGIAEKVSAAKALASLSFEAAEIRTEIARAGVVDVLVQHHRSAVNAGNIDLAASVTDALAAFKDGSCPKMKALPGHETALASDTDADELKELVIRAWAGYRANNISGEQDSDSESWLT